MPSPSSPVPELALPGRWATLRKLSRLALGLVLLLWGVLLVVWLTVHWVILPHIDEWRPTIERHAGRALGLQLRIGEIRVHSSGWVPALQLHDLRLLDRDGHEALHLERVTTALSPQSLLALRLRFDQVLIDGASLDVRRDRDGRWFVAGLAIDDERPDDSRLRDWFFAQREFVVRNANLRWTDELHGAPPLQLTQLELVLRNSRRRHALRLDATPPPELGERFSLRGRFTQPLLASRSELQRWSGTLFLDAPRTTLVGLRRQFGLDAEWHHGEAALRAWLDIGRGAPLRGTLDFQVHDLSMRLASDLQPLALQRLGGRLDAERDADGLQLHARQLVWTADPAGTQAGAPGAVALSLRQKQDLGSWSMPQQPVTGGDFSVERVELQWLAQTAARLPLGENVHRLIAELAPQGRIEGLKAGWQGPPGAPDRYRVEASLSGLQLEAAAPPADLPSPHRPGLRNAALEFTADERGGQAQLRLKAGALVFPGMWAQPEMPIDTLDAKLAWRIVPVDAQPPRIEVEVDNLRFANADMAGELKAAWRTGGGSGVGSGARLPGILDFTGRLTRGRAERVARYLPLGIEAQARDYVQRAIQGGAIASADFRVKGDLWDFPFHQSRDGEFRVKVQARGLRYAYLPDRDANQGLPARVSPWPAFDQVSGELEFDRMAMHFRQVQGRLWGFELSDVNGGVADLTAAQPVVSVQGQGQGPVADVLRFLRVTPLGPWIGPEIDALDAGGSGQLRLALQLPLAQPERSTVVGSLQFSGGDVRIRPDLPVLAAARGQIDFTERSFALSPTSVRVLGGEATLDGGSAPDGALRFNAQGVASAEALRALPQLGAAAELASRLHGRSAYRASLGVLEGRAEFALSSNLTGMRIDLPAPLAKPAELAWPLRVQNTLLPRAADGRTRDTLRVELGPALKASYLRELTGAAPRVLRGEIGVFDAPPEPGTGVRASLKLGRVDLDAWSALLEGGVGTGEASAYLPQAVELQAEELVMSRQRVSNLKGTLRRQDAAQDTWWRARLSADQLAGDIEYRQPRGVGQPGGVRARLQRLSLPRSEVAGVEQLLAQPPDELPALDIQVEDFELRGRKLGRLDVQAVNRMSNERGGAWSWQLDKLNLTLPEARLEATGRWLAGSAPRMALDFDLKLADSGALAERLGASSALRGGKGRVRGDMSWEGSPLTLDYPSLQGRLDIALQSGQLLQAEPGGARLLGVFSLAALPRRLLLDFRDVFQEGFAFDSVAGRMDIAKGVAETRNLRIQGVQAIVLMEGSADLLRETQDLQVLVVPNLDAGGAALAYMAVNPAIGLGTLVAQWLLREPLMLAGTREFRINGDWADPKVQRIERSADSPLPKVDAPAAASAPATPGDAAAQPAKEAPR